MKGRKSERRILLERTPRRIKARRKNGKQKLVRKYATSQRELMMSETKCLGSYQMTFALNQSSAHCQKIMRHEIWYFVHLYKRSNTECINTITYNQFASI